MSTALTRLCQTSCRPLAAALLLLCAALPAAAQEPAKLVDGKHFGTMAGGMQELAQHIARTLKAEGLERIAVGTFKSDNSLDGTTFGPRIVTALREQLEATKDVQIASVGAWNVSGEYGGQLNRGNGKFEIFIKSKLKDQFGTLQSELVTPIITNETEALAMLGSNVALPLAAPSATSSGSQLALELARAESIDASVKQPQVNVSGSVVRATSTSPYGIEILVGGQPVPATFNQNRPFVDLGPNKQYTIRLINDSNEDAGVALSIDGINTLAFSTYRELGLWVIPAHSRGEIRGWHIQGTEASSFVVTELANAPAAQLGAVGNIGTITASFRAAFVDDLPPGEPPPGSKGFATGKGPPIDQPLSEVKRQFGVVRESVSVQYLK